MRFSDEDKALCIKLFNENKSTKYVQDILIEKYNIKRSNTSNFIKSIRKQLGIYKKEVK